MPLSRAVNGRSGVGKPETPGWCSPIMRMKLLALVQHRGVRILSCKFDRDIKLKLGEKAKPVMVVGEEVIEVKNESRQRLSLSAVEISLNSWERLTKQRK